MILRIVSAKVAIIFIFVAFCLWPIVPIKSSCMPIKVHLSNLYAIKFFKRPINVFKFVPFLNMQKVCHFMADFFNTFFFFFLCLLGYSLCLIYFKLGQVHVSMHVNFTGYKNKYIPYFFMGCMWTNLRGEKIFIYIFPHSVFFNNNISPTRNIKY